MRLLHPWRPACKRLRKRFQQRHQFPDHAVPDRHHGARRVRETSTATPCRRLSDTDAAGTASLLSKAVEGLTRCRSPSTVRLHRPVDQGLEQQQSIAQLLQSPSASDPGALISGFELLGAANPTGNQTQAIQQYAQSLSASNALGANTLLVSSLFGSFSTYA